MVRRDRRAVLAAVGAGVSGVTGGCLDRLGNVAGDGDEQVSVRVKAPARNDDPLADGVARAVASWYRTAGMAASVASLAPSELRSQVLDDHDFDVFVSRAPERFNDPDGLHSLLHSRYAAGPGWTNPFGVTDESIDGLLESQRRRSGGAREDAVADLAWAVVEREPFSVVCFPAEIRTARRDRFVGFEHAPLADPLGYLSLRRTETDGDASDASEGQRAGTLHLVTTNQLVTETMNPLTMVDDPPVSITDLLYDSLGRRLEDDVVQWLAADWTFEDDGGAPRATVELRRDRRWHDGEPVTADDVAFTYALLADVRLSDAEDAIAVPRFEDRTSLVEEVSTEGDRTVAIQFVDCDQSVAARALTVPIFPEHVWRDLIESTDDEAEQSVPAAFETNNVPPIGSGPLTYAGHVPGERLTLESNEAHFLATENLRPSLDRFAEGPAFDRLVLDVVGADTSAVERVASGEADATATSLSPETVPRVASAEDLRLYTDDTPAFYIVGYNARREHLSNHRFRTVLGGLLDQADVVRSVFEGYASPAASPLAGTPWLPEDLRWEDEDPATPFLGSDGDLDTERARDAFREIGYRYDGDTLVTR